MEHPLKKLILVITYGKADINTYFLIRRLCGASAIQVPVSKLLENY